MTSANHKEMKHLYQKAVAVTTVVVNDWDPLSLISVGAPKDEFSSEVSRIVAKAQEAGTPEALAKVISDVFSSSFESESFSVEVCLPVASRLFGELRISGFVESEP